jgi:nitrite reductase (NADH) small subunit
MHHLAEVDELSEGEIRKFNIDGKYILLVQGELGPAAINGVCPHAGGDLGKGSVSGNRLRCPTHKYLFDLKTGDCPLGRREGWGAATIYKLEEIDGHIYIDLNSTQ